MPCFAYGIFPCSRRYCSAAVLKIRSAGDYERLVNEFGTRRSSQQFWPIFDAINSVHISSDPVRAGTLDLTRYALDAK
jgi:hypothetical protein